MATQDVMNAIMAMHEAAKAKRKPLVFVTCDSEMCVLKRMKLESGMLTLEYAYPGDDDAYETQVEGKRVVITDTRIRGKDVDNESFEIFIP